MARLHRPNILTSASDNSAVWQWQLFTPASLQWASASLNHMQVVTKKLRVTATASNIGQCGMPRLKSEAELNPNLRGSSHRVSGDGCADHHSLLNVYLPYLPLSRQWQSHA